MGVGEAKSVDITGVPEKELCLKGGGRMTDTPERFGGDRVEEPWGPCFLGRGWENLKAQRITGHLLSVSADGLGTAPKSFLEPREVQGQGLECPHSPRAGRPKEASW